MYRPFLAQLSQRLRQRMHDVHDHLISLVDEYVRIT